MSDTITLTKDEMAEIVAQAAAKVAEDKGLAFSSTRAQSILRAVGNVTDVTETLGLPLPQGNEVVAYQDFINAANLIIDNFAKTTDNTLDSVSATATAAANGVSAGDAKITQINTRLTQDEVDSLPQFKQDTDSRLESVENDVMGLSGWTSLFTASGSTTPTESVKKSSIGLWISANRTNTESWFNVTEVCKNYYGHSVNTGMKYKSSWGYTTGNVFNLPETNVIYLLQHYTTGQDGTLHTSAYGLKWNGTTTELLNLSTTNVVQYFDTTIMPFVRM